MPYRYLEDIALADAAFEAWADTLEGVMIAAADATMNVMVEELATIRPLEHRAIRLGPEAVDMLLYGLLEELVYYKDAEQLLLRVCEVRLSRGEEGWSLAAEAQGERLDARRHRLAADVKAVTQTATGWRAFVILDI